MKKYFSLRLVFLPIAVAVISIQVCCNKRTISSNEKTQDSIVSGKKFSDGFSISPNHFRVEAIVTDEPAVDTLVQKIIYRLLIRKVLERGSSLIYLVTAGDTIASASATITKSSVSMIKNGDEVIAFIEERMQLGSDQPLFLLRSIQKK